tara:strand:+ start:995 stop:3247 length:2253 start_codon:yes stop_codon:yes gene_type:complete
MGNGVHPSDAGINTTSPDKVYVHRNETKSTFITVQNTASAEQTLTVEALEVPEPLLVAGLPQSALLEPNQLHQFRIEIKAPANAAFQNLNTTFSILSDTDTDLNETVSMEIHIVPYSNLNFGAEGVSAFTVDEMVRTSVAVNITNNASYVDNVVFSLHTNSGWTWGWSMPNISGNEAYISMEPDALAIVSMWIDVPAVVDGAPLANTGPRFQIDAVSSLDKAVTTWRFDLQMNEKKNASIDDIETALSVAPNSDGRISALVRNVGNTPNTLNITLRPIDSDGTPQADAEPSDRFNSNGWVVALFGGLEDIVLEPNETRLIEIGFQAPNTFDGEMHVELQVFASGAQSSLKTARTFATIDRVSSGLLEHSQQGCQSISPGKSCDVELTATNTGNSYNTFRLNGQVTDEAFELEMTEATLLLQPGESKTFTASSIFAAESALAYTQDNLTIELLDDTGSVVDQTVVALAVATKINWTFQNISKNVDENGRLSFSLLAFNNGNVADGLTVHLRSSHAVDMGLVPPATANYEADVKHPRSFDVSGIPLGSNLTIEAWVQLPQDQLMDGTVYINTTVTSQLAPETAFVHTTTADYTGASRSAPSNEDGGTVLSELGSTAVLLAKAWWGVVTSVAFATVIIFQAIKARQRRAANSAIMPYQEPPETSDDWMERFKKTDTEPKQLTNMAAAAPEQMHGYQVNQQREFHQPPQAAVDSALIDKANALLHADDSPRVEKVNITGAETLPKHYPDDDLEF